MEQKLPEIIQRYFKADLNVDEIYENRNLIKKYVSSKRLFESAYKQVHGIDAGYRYLITFTQDPKKCGHKSTNDIRDYILKQFKREPLQVVQAWIVQEGNGKDKHIHWHVAVETTKALKKDRFSYYLKKYGNIDISKTNAKHLQHALDYISKESNPTCIVTKT